ncbi:C-type lectin mannose-binding isoform-like [Haliotis rubra]|uniref:C-type lectin mannose-binding isoform-like n=1 Tax=Haliotis rubra TaxID=36100 RepID=UPI001EE5E854|nr:C-type lectin mannose-binding isoform-like [Haliotis rubra]
MFGLHWTNMASMTLGFLYASIVIASVTADCLNGWTQYASSCYRLFRNDKNTWPEAGFECEKHGAYLVSIETQQESVDMHALVEELNLGDLDKVWIGLSDVREEGVWVWESTRQNATFFDWAPSEPNQKDTVQQDCVILYGKQHLQWADDRCEYKYEYICESPVNTAPALVG